MCTQQSDDLCYDMLALTMQVHWEDQHSTFVHMPEQHSRARSQGGSSASGAAPHSTTCPVAAQEPALTVFCAPALQKVGLLCACPSLTLELRFDRAVVERA